MDSRKGVSYGKMMIQLRQMVNKGIQYQIDFFRIINFFRIWDWSLPRITRIGTDYKLYIYVVFNTIINLVLIKVN